MRIETQVRVFKALLVFYVLTMLMYAALRILPGLVRAQDHVSWWVWYHWLGVPMMLAGFIMFIGAMLKWVFDDEEVVS